jgi:hypothetical protein
MIWPHQHTLIGNASAPQVQNISPVRCIWGLITLSIIAALLGACSGNDTRPYPYFDQLEIVDASTQFQPSKAGTAAELTTAGAAEGAARGVTAGAAISLLCGPLFVACAGVIVPLTAVPAVTGGALYGLSGMEREDAEYVNAYFAELPTRRDLNQELKAAVTSLIPKQRIATAKSDAVLTLGIATIGIYHELSNSFYLKLNVTAKLEWTGKGNKPHDAGRNFECDTASQEASVWLEDKGRKLDEALTLCMDVLAGLVNGALSSTSKTSKL